MYAILISVKYFFLLIFPLIVGDVHERAHIGAVKDVSSLQQKVY